MISQPRSVHDHIFGPPVQSLSQSSASPANNMSKMGTLGAVQHVTSHSGVSPSDPFGAALATNLQHPGINII